MPVLYQSETSDRYTIHFEAPAKTNGPINQYRILQTKTVNGKHIETKHNLTGGDNNNYYNKDYNIKNLPVDCSSNFKLISETFHVQIAAVNIEYILEKNISIEWIGEYSEKNSINLCFSKTVHFIVISIGVIFILFLFIFTIIFGVKNFIMIKRIKQLKIKVLSNEQTAHTEQCTENEQCLHYQVHHKLELNNVIYDLSYNLPDISQTTKTDLTVKEENKKENWQTPSAPLNAPATFGYTSLPEKQTKF